MEVRDHDARASERVVIARGDQVALAVVVVRILWEQHPEPVADGEAGGDDQEGVGEALVLFVRGLVERLPGDQHRHHNGLAGAGCHLQRDPEEPRVGVVGGFAEEVDDPGVLMSLPADHLADVDRRLDGLDLAEEELALAARVGPVVEQSPGGRGDARVAALPPDRHPLADAVDRGVLLDAVRRPLGLELHLVAAPLALGDRHEVGRHAAALEHLVRDAVLRELPMPRWLVEGRVEDRVIDQGVGHKSPCAAGGGASSQQLIIGSLNAPVLSIACLPLIELKKGLRSRGAAPAT